MSGLLAFNSAANDRTIIRINNDADASADMTIELVGLKTLSRTAGVDFVL